jgi:hypothetical protein
MIAFLIAGMGLYFGGRALLSLEPLDWAAPAWTAKHVGLLATSLLVGALAALFAAVLAMTVEVRNERLSDGFIVLWQFLANASMYWFGTMGTAMSIALGRDGTKRAVLNFGAELATVHVVGTGCIVGLLLGAIFFFGPSLRLPRIGYLILSASVAMLAARSHFEIYHIEGKGWIAAGVVFTLFLLFFTPVMIERDRRERRLMMEQSQRDGTECSNAH